MDGSFFATDSNVRDSAKNGGSISVGGFSLSASGSTFEYFKHVAATDTPTAQACFGTSTTFSMAGYSPNGFAAFSTTMYVPTEIVLDTPCLCHRTGISLNNNLNVRWNSDPLNTDVYIVLSYKGGISHIKNSSLSATDIIKTYTVSDNGHFTIPKADFSTFPIGGIAQLMIGRGNGTFYTTSNGKKNPIDCILQYRV